MIHQLGTLTHNKKIEPDERFSALPDFSYRKYKIWQGTETLAG